MIQPSFTSPKFLEDDSSSSSRSTLIVDLSSAAGSGASPTSPSYDASSEDSASMLPAPIPKKRKLDPSNIRRYKPVRYFESAAASFDSSSDDDAPLFPPNDNNSFNHNHNNNNNNSNNNQDGDDNNNGNNGEGGNSSSPFVNRRTGMLEINIGHERNLYVSSDGTYIRFALRNAANTEVVRRRVHLSLRRWKKLVESFDEIQESVLKLTRMEDVNYFLHLGNKMHVSVKTGIFCVDIRKFWFPAGKTEMAPGIPAVSLKLKEFAKLRQHLNEINSFVHLDKVSTCFHSSQAAKEACEECTALP